MSPRGLLTEVVCFGISFWGSYGLYIGGRRLWTTINEKFASHGKPCPGTTITYVCKECGSKKCIRDWCLIKDNGFGFDIIQSSSR